MMAPAKLNFSVWLAVLTASLDVARAAQPVPEGEIFKLHRQLVTIPERGPVTVHALETAHHRLSFWGPPGWIIKENPKSREVVMIAQDLVSCLSFKIMEGPPPGDTRPVAEQWRQAARETHPTAKILGEFDCYTSNAAGRAMDLERVTSVKSKQLTRLAFVPLPEGRVEFKLTAPSDKFRQHRFAFGNFLTSFRVEPRRREQVDKAFSRTPP